MSSFKSFSMSCILGATVLMGCTTHSANLLPNPAVHSAPTLQSHHWKLQQALTPQGALDQQWQIPASSRHPARSIELDFSDDQRIHVSRLCNTINGGYSVQDEKISVNRLAATMIACNDNALMQLEKNVASQLPKVRTWHIAEIDADTAAPTLELQFDSGAKWLLTGVPTHETLYGNSERIFLEIAPEKLTCSRPPLPASNCLKVREVKYSEQGVKQTSGPWINYDASIEGYQHQPGVRNILRVKRFTRDPARTDISKYIDVLDLVVESEISR